MNEEARKLWTAALRSGEYKQGEGQLRGRGGYCCLGVLCDVAFKTGAVQGSWKRRTDGIGIMGVRTFHAVCSQYASDVHLPLPVQEWVGTTRNFEAFLEGQNDDGVPFSEIADLIDKA